MVTEKAVWSLGAECQAHPVIVIEHVQFFWLLLNWGEKKEPQREETLELRKMMLVVKGEEEKSQELI